MWIDRKIDRAYTDRWKNYIIDTYKDRRIANRYMNR